MKKRIAYIGLSYPLLYDYKNQASLSQNDLSDSPNPIIESPLGLMILYDELWFLCESVCPNNMRRLPYVKFVDKMFEELYFGGAEAFIEECNLKIHLDRGLSYDAILRRMNLENRYEGLDIHSHGLQIGDVVRSGNSGADNLAFDLYVLTALQEVSGKEIELITNSRCCLEGVEISDKEPKVVEQLVIPNIPNYLHADGPYHPCMEELRNNKYISDFRKWVIENHNTIQSSEINEMCTSVIRNIEEAKTKAFKKHLEDNDKYTFFASSGVTILKTAVGVVWWPFSVMDAGTGIIKKGADTVKVNNDRWQGFVVNSREIAEANNLSV